MDNNDQLTVVDINEAVRLALYDLKACRESKEKHEKLLREAREKFDSDSLHTVWKRIIEDETKLEEKIRQELLDLQKDQPSMLHPAIKSLRTDKKYKFDTKKAIEWCKVNAPILLTVGKEFNDFLKKNAPPEFVEIEETKSIVIASDLSKFKDL